MQAIVCSATEISQDAFDELHVRIARGMHEETHLLYRIGEIGPSEFEVLKGSGEATVLGGVVKETTIMGRQLGFCVDGSGDWLVVEHLGTFKDLEYILLLTQEQAVGVGCDVDAK